MSSTAKRYLIWGAVGLAVLAGLVFAFRPIPVPVDLAEIDRGTVTVTLDEEGRTRVRDIYTVSAPIPGRVERIQANSGDRVIANVSVLAAIRPMEPTLLDARREASVRAEIEAAKANLDLARASVDRAGADLKFAETELTRARTLVERSVVSNRELDLAETERDRARAALKSARANVLARRADLERAQAELTQATDAADLGSEGCCIHVIAPISGHVLRVLHEDEGVVPAGEPLIELGALDDMEVVVEALSTEAVKVVDRAPVAIERWGGGETLRGHVRRVEPYGFTKVSALGIEEQRVNVLVDFEEPERAGGLLGHGYRVEVRVRLDEAADAVRVPVAALFRADNRWAVFSVTDGRVALREISLGLMNDRTAEVLTGLEPGEKVVLRPDDRIENGVLVVPRPG
jgi:HlyD family secretion protein